VRGAGQPVGRRGVDAYGSLGPPEPGDCRRSVCFRGAPADDSQEAAAAKKV